jgi:hypothetical protein
MLDFTIEKGSGVTISHSKNLVMGLKEGTTLPRFPITYFAVATLQTACRGGAARPAPRARSVAYVADGKPPFFFLQSEVLNLVPPKKYLPLTGIFCTMQKTHAIFDRARGGQFIVVVSEAC